MHCRYLLDSDIDLKEGTLLRVVRVDDGTLVLAEHVECKAGQVRTGPSFKPKPAKESEENS